MKVACPRDLALAAVYKHIEVHGDLDTYRGIVTLHALARLATANNDEALIQTAREQFLPYVRGERYYECNFENYLCGGLGSAYLLWQNKLPEAEQPVREQAERLMTRAVRDSDGIFSFPRFPEDEKVWIDVAFAVSPFLLFAGLHFDNADFIAESLDQTEKMYRLFLDPANGLVHQSRGFGGRLPGGISEDHWSRGNGWLAYSLAELIAHIPADHARRPTLERIFRDFLAACAAVQNEHGLWHQEMTAPESYVETSGSALILYAIGVGLKTGILDATWRERFESGLSGLLRYISDDIDIYHTCTGCLCPGSGTPLEYMAKPPVLNDSHAFGPVALAMGQAHRLGIQEIHIATNSLF